MIPNHFCGVIYVVLQHIILTESQIGVLGLTPNHGLALDWLAL